MCSPLFEIARVFVRFVSPISAFTQEDVSIKGKHEFFIIRIGRSGQFETASSITPDPFLFGVFVAKDQRNHQTQSAHRCYHSQNGWNAEFTL